MPYRFHQVPSLRRRFILAGSILIGAIALTTMQLVSGYSQKLADISYDRLLRSAILQMDENIISINNKVSIDIPWSAFATLAQASDDRIFYRVESSRNGFITGNKNLITQPPVPSELGKIQFYNQDFSNEEIRVAWLERATTEGNSQETVRIVLGQTRLAREDMSADISIKTTRIIMFIALVAIVLMAVVSHLVLRPLRRITEQLEARKPGDLTPLKIKTPKETEQLKVSINHFMDRLQTNLAQLENFTSESAHQLRTPLASLKALAENARDETTPQKQKRDLNNIVHQCEKLSQTVTMLLNQAVVSHRLQTQNLVPIDLVKLVHQACMEQAVTALQQGVRLSFDSKVTKAMVLADAFSLQQMLNNLIDNAIRYSDTKQGPQQVDICLTTGTQIGQVNSQAQHVMLSVIDYGYGIAEQEKVRVFERFYRGHYEISGSGVGLAMVKDIADRHQAQIRVKDTQPKGATIEVTFPLRTSLSAKYGK
ncbi:sensor histidine kinase [Marinomonas agarivorans]|nr:sensor histidine kinase [Marinomonas agarivorans]